MLDLADPFQGKKLFANLNSNKTYNGQVVYSGTKADWGQKIHNGQAGDPAGWAGDWNLEAARKDNAWWAVNVAFHRCNW